MAIMGQAPQPDNWTKAMAMMRFAVKLPIIAMGIVAAVMASWVTFWFIVRLSMYIYQTWLNEPWN